MSFSRSPAGDVLYFVYLEEQLWYDAMAGSGETDGIVFLRGLGEGVFASCMCMYTYIYIPKVYKTTP